MDKAVALIGYSGHALVVADILGTMGKTIAGYYELSAVDNNPLTIPYLGFEGDQSSLEALSKLDYVVAIGDNSLRKKVHQSLYKKLGFPPLTIVHSSAIVANSAQLEGGVMVGAGVVVNAHATLGEGAICNSNSTIEHECELGAFCHVAPGCVLCGNVKVGEGTLLGANSTIIPNKTIGSNCVVGAGSVLIKNVESNQKVVGNPARII